MHCFVPLCCKKCGQSNNAIQRLQDSSCASVNGTRNAALQLSGHIHALFVAGRRQHGAQVPQIMRYLRMAD